MTNYKQTAQHKWAMAGHLSNMILYIGIPFGNMLGPLLVWLIKKDEMPLVNDQAKEALNFQITMTFAYFLAFILSFILIGFFLLAGLAIFNIIISVIAAVKSNQGIVYRYPINIRLIR